MRILVIEDDDAVGAALRRALMLAGYEDVLAGDGEDGLLQVETAVPNALVLDLGVPPGSTGWTCADSCAAPATERRF